MATAKNWKPDHVSTVTPYLIIKDCAKAVDFYKKAFGAEEMHRLCAPDGKIMHSCVKLGDSSIFLCDEMDDPSCGSSPSHSVCSDGGTANSCLPMICAS